MWCPDPLFTITRPDELRQRCGMPASMPAAKVRDQVNDAHRELILASPFLIMTTVGPNGLHCTSRGDRAGLAEVLDEKTLVIPERPGNQRLDSLNNLLRDSRIGLIFLVPGVEESIRVSGRATISMEPDLIGRFMQDGTLPRLVIVVSVETVLLQCARAAARADLWNPARQWRPDGFPKMSGTNRPTSTGQHQPANTNG